MSDASPLSVVVRYVVKPGMEQRFEAWMGEAVRLASTFPGHGGATLLRPGDHSHPEYVMVFRFAAYDDLRRWNDSPERVGLLDRLNELVSEVRLNEASGLETWVTLPGAKSVPPLPRWKMATLSLIGIYPLALLIPLALPSAVGSWPGPLRTLFVSSLMIAAMTWIVMPQVTRILQFWIAAPKLKG